MFFRKQIAVINPKILPVAPQATLTEAPDIRPEPSAANDVRVTADKKQYGHREQVSVSVSGLPADLIDLIVSVRGKDSLVSPAVVRQLDKMQAAAWASPHARQMGPCLPEYEGHIATARISPHTTNVGFFANLSFVGGDIRYINGQVDPQGETVSFYTSGIYGCQDLVLTAAVEASDKTSYQLDIVEPFVGSLPDHLSALAFYPAQKQLTDRYVASQVARVVEADTL